VQHARRRAPRPAQCGLVHPRAARLGPGQRLGLGVTQRLLQLTQFDVDLAKVGLDPCQLTARILAAVQLCLSSWFSSHWYRSERGIRIMAIVAARQRRIRERRRMFAG